jgi:glycosyltransferase involved in cell wall biosynthesis
MPHAAQRRAVAAAKRALRVMAPPGTARRRYALRFVRRLRGSRGDADQLLAAASADLAAGRTPRHLDAVFAAGIARADANLRKGNVRAAATWLDRTGSVVFHKGVHFRLSSPLAENPRAFLAPLHNSDLARVMQARTRSVPAAPGPTDRPLRLLFATRENANFLAEIRRHFEAHPAVEVRFVDLADDERHRHLVRGGAKLIEAVLAGESGYAGEVEAWLRPHLDWADTVFVDWCNSPAVLFTAVDPGTTRIIVRLHSFEAFVLWPHLVSLARLDDLVVVSEHMRRLVTAVLPGLGAAGAPRTHVIPNAMDLARFVRPKPPEARFTIGLVGYSAVAKDARWAVEVLRLLRDRDDRYRLMLVGSAPNPQTNVAAREYYQQLDDEVVELERQGAVLRVGHTDDVPGVLTGIGVILSSSVRESFHCALVEGAASGAVPVVRDWPFFARGGGGAREIFPTDWVVGSPRTAAERILEQTATETGWREAGAAASRHAVETWDWPATRPLFDQLVLGRLAGLDGATHAENTGAPRDEVRAPGR